MLLMQIFQCIFNALAVTGNLNQQGAEEDILQLVGITGNNAYVNIKMRVYSDEASFIDVIKKKAAAAWQQTTIILGRNNL